MSPGKMLTTVVCLLVLGCSKNHADTDDAVIDANAPTDPEPNDIADLSDGVVDRPIEELAGGWVLSEHWTGFMGVAIQFEGEQIKYWFYSDVRSGDEPDYPISGTWRWDGAVLQLNSAARLHDDRWHVYRHNGELCLLPDYALQWHLDDGKGQRTDRLLFKISDFDPDSPFATRRQ